MIQPGKTAEADITATGGGGGSTDGITGCGWCTASIRNGFQVHCR
ncbi:hypothetical protein [Polymorphospora rubra]|nr:hypothetical protein [Polymorphospora rubra]